ncbi:hypothetical protein D3Z62_05320 [Lachnospiraceae bacterium]|nr:hypothetical protein [Lachnospiraceae bacterium]
MAPPPDGPPHPFPAVKTGKNSGIFFLRVDHAGIKKIHLVYPPLAFQKILPGISGCCDLVCCLPV